MTFEDQFRMNGNDLDIRGTGLFRYLEFIKAYVGALYMPADIPSEEALSDTPKRLEVEYFYAIKGEDFGPATNKVMARNVDAETFERLRPLVDYHNGGEWLVTHYRLVSCLLLIPFDKYLSTA